MAWGLAASLGLGALGSFLGRKSRKDTARDASRAQIQAAQLGIDEQRRQFDTMRESLSPYIQGGEAAFSAQQDLLGIGEGGQEAQQVAIQNIQNDPRFQALEAAGQNAILQNASATGGLRGGNAQAALGQFSPALLSNEINQRFQNLGGISQAGQASAAGVGNAGLQTGANISGLYGQQGDARAGRSIATGKADSQFYGDLAQTIGNLF